MAVNASIRVVSVAPYQFLPARFGGHRAIAFFYRYFSREIAFSCVSVQGNESDVFADYQQYRILGKSFLRYVNFFNVFKIGKIVKREHATHIMTEHPYLGWLVLWVRLLYKTKVVIRSHNIESQRFKTMGKWWWRILYWYEGIIYRKADTVFFITEEDRQFAIKNYRVRDYKTSVVTYGFQPPHTFSPEWKSKVTGLIREKNNLPQDRKVLLFNGDFGYKPNAQALRLLVEEIVPQLEKRVPNFILIVCGKSIPEEIKQQKNPSIITKGFVDDIGAYFAGSDVFLNPITDGGGIKTKLVEALSYETLAVSFESGAIGIPREIIDDKLVYVPDGDTTAFVEGVIRQLDNHSEWNCSQFKKYFNWENIAKNAHHFLNGLLAMNS
ncbi:MULTISPECIES: glycosyltransferase family 4 protein [Chitinophagaceae]